MSPRSSFWFQTVERPVFRLASTPSVGLTTPPPPFRSQSATIGARNDSAFRPKHHGAPNL